MITVASAPATASRPPASKREQETGFLVELAQLVRWTGRTLAELPQAVRFPAEVLRQLAAILTSSSLVLWLVSVTVGGILAQYGHYVLATIGAQGYIGLLTSLGTLKALLPVFFGFMFAAKVGCGFAAELGSMRINEEIDALNVIGVPARQFLVGTRVLASIIALPILYIVGVAASFVGAYVSVVHIFGTVSPGGYSSIFWSIVTPVDLLVSSLVWTCGCGVIAAIVACYYGYHARGGPVEVGEAAARSMMVNVVVITVLGSGIMYQLFYGAGTVLPITN